MTFFPPCTASRVMITQAQYDYYRECEERLKETQPARARELAAYLRDHYTPEPRQPEYSPTTTQPAAVIDCATGQPWQPGPRRRPAQLAPYGVRPGDLAPPPKPAEPKRPRGWQEPIERIQPIKIQTQEEPEPPAWLAALAIPEPEPGAVYRPLTGGPAQPPDRAPGEKPKPRKKKQAPRRKRAAGSIPVDNWPTRQPARKGEPWTR